MQPNLKHKKTYFPDLHYNFYKRRLRKKRFYQSNKLFKVILCHKNILHIGNCLFNNVIVIVYDICSMHNEVADGLKQRSAYPLGTVRVATNPLLIKLYLDISFK